MNENEILQYKDEIVELTTLLNTKWAASKKVLLEKYGINTKESLLVGYYETEEGAEYGILMTKEREIIQFVIRRGKVYKRITKDVNKLEKAHPPVTVALHYWE
ncbi:MAG: hypothetical protein FWG14_06585 [Peptococcaceae bacterium]|nr:hypothetical protein [Peptococcaceae bacterium]